MDLTSLEARLQRLEEALDTRFNRVEDKLDKHLERLPAAEADIRWLKGSVKASFVLLTGVLAKFIHTTFLK